MQVSFASATLLSLQSVEAGICRRHVRGHGQLSSTTPDPNKNRHLLNDRLTCVDVSKRTPI